MRSTKALHVFSIKFCVFIIIIHVNNFMCTHGGRSFVFAQSGTEHNVATMSKQIKKTTMEDITFSPVEKLKAFRTTIKDCVEQKRETTWNCLKMSALHAFDEVSKAAVIPLWSGVRFVRSNDTEQSNEITNADISYQRQDLQHLTWFDSMAMRLAKILNTHILQLNFKEMTDAYIKEVEMRESKNSRVGTARGRRHRYNMLITMMFGVTALGAVLIPMGFQLLSIVSGKALLMAKMALLLASINGLKRLQVANSGVHYGLYQVPGEHYSGYYDRGDLQHPRNVPGMTIAQPFEFGVRK